MEIKQAPGNLFKEPMASKLEQNRATARRKGRILTFDCFDAKVNGSTVRCYIGVKAPILAILRGRTTNICQNCKAFDN